ncbi:hypothetical protein BGW41_001201 [Actinomortierella wolfii]|nr:hypothetical protein BGW41_001201 [Actinomortierella wolfii]
MEWVTPATLLAHLRLLRCLQSLVIVDDEDLDFLYLIRSEERYLMYLDMLQQHQPAPSEVPLPPIDVALMWTVHMLAPFRYHEDLLRNYSPHMLNYAFPLLRYVDAIDIEAPTTDDEAFAASKEMWRKTYPTEPFDLDKHDTSRMFEIQCLWCGSLNIMDSPTFIKFRIDGMTIDCAGCGSTCSLETLSSKRLWEGIEAYRSDSSQLLAGSLLSLWTGTPDPVTAQREHHHLFFHPRIQFALDQASVSMHCTWPKVIRAFQDLGPDQYYGIRPTTLARVMSSYMGLIEDRLSMDLVAGALRQRDFQKAMMETGGQAWCQPQVLERSLQRYKKFLLLTRAEGKHGLRQGLVPTLDIDLAWHTHMLHPWHYRQFQLAHYGRVLNHDDTVQATSVVTRQDFVRTAQLWQDVYQERYSFQPIKKLKKLKDKKNKKKNKNGGALRKGGAGGGGVEDLMSDDGMTEDGLSLTDQSRRRKQRHAKLAKEVPKWCAGVVFPPFGIYLILKTAHKSWRRRQREHHERRRRAKEEKQPQSMGHASYHHPQQQQDEKGIKGHSAPRIEGVQSGDAAGVGSSQSPSPIQLGSPQFQGTGVQEQQLEQSSLSSTPMSATLAVAGAGQTSAAQVGHGQHRGSVGGTSTASKKKLEPNLGLDGRLTNWNSEIAGPEGQASCSSGACIMSPWSELQDIVPYVDQAPSKELRSQRSHA